MSMWTKKLTVIGGLALLVLSVAPDAAAQIVYGQPAAGNAQVIYYHWTTDTDGNEKTVNQFMIPLFGFVPIQDNFDLTFFVANSSNTYETAGLENKLSGLGNFRLQANHSFLNDQLLVSASVNAPTGKKELDGEQSLVLMELSRNYLEFPMRQFGEGFGFSLLVGGAMQLADGFRAGAGVSYEYVGEYTPYERVVNITQSVSDSTALDTVIYDYEGYDPGDVFSVNGGVDYERGLMLWSLDIIFSQYMADKRSDIKVFKQSRQFDWRLRSVYTGERVQFRGMARYVWRGKNRLYNDLGQWEFTRKLFGNEFLLLGELTYAVNEQWYAVPSVDFRTIASDDNGFESSNVIGFGADLGRRFGENLDARAGFKLFTGSADGGDTDLSGYRITLGLTATL